MNSGAKDILAVDDDLEIGKMIERTIVYIGSYSSFSGEGIYAFELDGKTGQLTPAFAPIQVNNPSYLSLSSSKRYLYAVLEMSELNGISGGGVVSYAIEDNGSLTQINSCNTYGIDPCYLSADSSNSFLVAANYSSGSLSIFPIEQQGAIKPCSLIITHTGRGLDPERQDSPHVHFTDFSPDEKYICTVDLGLDMVNFYRFDKQTADLQVDDKLTITLHPGSGPRHLVFREQGKWVYVVTELSSEIAVFQYADGQYKPRQYLSTLPSNFKGNNAAAALHFSPNGQFLYASNRGHDSIAAFKVGQDGLLTQSGFYSAQGSGPRDFAIDPHGNFLLVANEQSNEVVVLKVDSTSGALTPTGSSIKLHSPTCIKFLSIIGHDE
jgi:6-phosphogluconolactonase